MYDYVGALGATFYDDFEYVLTRIDSASLWVHYHKNGFPHENKAADAVRASIKSNMTEIVKVTLAEKYKEDFDLFGFHGQEWD